MAQEARPKARTCNFLAAVGYVAVICLILLAVYESVICHDQNQTAWEPLSIESSNIVYVVNDGHLWKRSCQNYTRERWLCLVTVNATLAYKQHVENLVYTVSMTGPGEFAPPWNDSKVPLGHMSATASGNFYPEYGQTVALPERPSPHCSGRKTVVILCVMLSVVILCAIGAFHYMTRQDSQQRPDIQFFRRLPRTRLCYETSRDKITPVRVAMLGVLVLTLPMISAALGFLTACSVRDALNSSQAFEYDSVPCNVRQVHTDPPTQTPLFEIHTQLFTGSEMCEKGCPMISYNHARFTDAELQMLTVQSVSEMHECYVNKGMPHIPPFSLKPLPAAAPQWGPYLECDHQKETANLLGVTAAVLAACSFIFAAMNAETEKFASRASAERRAPLLDFEE